MRTGQIKLFEGINPEKVFEEANAFMSEKKTCVAQTHIRAAPDGGTIYSIVVFYDI